MRRILYTASVTVLYGLLTASAAMAASDNDAKQVGKNLGNMLSGWANQIFIGVTAILACWLLSGRRSGELAGFALAAVVVAGFAVPPHPAVDVSMAIWRAVVP